MFNPLPSFSNYSGVHALMFTNPNGDTFYFSYQTLVAFSTQKTGLVCLFNVWRTTTGKHLNAIQPDKSKRVSGEEFKRIYNLAFPQE